MSGNSDEMIALVASDSFWEPGNYKRTTKRTEDGFRLCNDLITLIQERSEIEKAYGKNLKLWSKKWNDLIEKGPEYGTTEAAWKALLIEGDLRCKMHVKIRDKLNNEVVDEIKKWQKDNYHKSMMQIKEKKEFDDAFKKAQKTWAKHLAKVEKCKTEYHTACKNEKSAINQERNASGDSSISPDQVKKLQDRVMKCKEEMQKTKEQYELSLSEIDEYNSKYIEDMKSVFQKCQEFEKKRLDFFKRTLFQIHDCLNILADADLPKIYDDCRHAIQIADAEKDLRWWSQNNGVDMKMNWPIFEDYTPEMQATRKDKKPGKENDNSIEINTINNRNGSGKTLSNPVRSSSIANNEKNEGHPFDDDQEEWDEYTNDAFEDNGQPGVPVRALYDYTGAEADELSFKQGDIFEKLEDEDEQGWCKGRKEGRVGLYPANYVEVVNR